MQKSFKIFVPEKKLLSGTINIPVNSYMGFQLYRAASYNGLSSERMKAIKSDYVNQFNIQRALHPSPVLTYYIYLASKKARNQTLPMVMCLDNFLSSLHI